MRNDGKLDKTVVEMAVVELTALDPGKLDRRQERGQALSRNTGSRTVKSTNRSPATAHVDFSQPGASALPVSTTPALPQSSDEPEFIASREAVHQTSKPTEASFAGRFAVRREWISFVFVLGLLPGPAGAQEVRGRVLADGTRDPISEAEVALIGAPGDTVARTMTDGQGLFHLKTVAAGRYVLAVRRLGYAAWSSPAFELPRGGWTDLEIRLGIDAIPLEPVRVIASAANARDGFRRRMAERGQGGHFITRDQIDRSASTRASDLLRAIPTVELRGEWSASNFTREERRVVLLREGSTSGCLATIYHDGVLVRQSAELTIDDYINPRTLEAVEIYSSTASSPAGYPAVGGCGVVLFWTRQQNAGRSGWSWKRFGVMLTAVGFMALLAR
jgi:hypothetical protein